LLEDYENEAVAELRRKAERLAQLTQEGDRLPIARRHLTQDILCAVLRLQGSPDPEGRTGQILRSFERSV
jgi:hypothetical protein